MKRMIRKIICWLVGCNWICLHRHTVTRDDINRFEATTLSGWECARCSNRKHEQWDG